MQTLVTRSIQARSRADLPLESDASDVEPSTQCQLLGNSGTGNPNRPRKIEGAHAFGFEA